MKWYFFLFAYCVFTGLMAQGKVLVDVVETQNGIRYEGEITHYEYGKLLTIILIDGEEIDLLARDIKRIRYAKQRRADLPAAAECHRRRGPLQEPPHNRRDRHRQSSSERCCRLDCRRRRTARGYAEYEAGRG